MRHVALCILLCSSFLAGVDAQAAFGLTTATDYYQVDTGAGLVFQVRRVEEAGKNPNTISIGDIRSLVYNGVEYQDTARGSQINSGFDFLGYSNSTVNVTAEVVNTDYIKVTVTTANLVHYYIARNGSPHIYMATWFNVQPVTGGGLCRYIVRMPYSNLPNGPQPSDLSGTDFTVESGDIFGFTSTNSNVALRGQTRSKHYSGIRLIDWFYTGATGDGVGVFMLRDSQEGGSGGPFYRSLINQGGGDQEITYIINYGEAQTESFFRVGTLNGPYALVFNNGQLPAAPLDYSWMETAGLNLTNWYAATNRGVVTGTATGIPFGFEGVVGFANTNGQYWAAVTNGTYTTPRMIPGNYNVTLYKQEYSVATSSVNVTAGMTNVLNLASTESTPAFIFKLGEWDGAPAGFLNGDKMTYMHPSDVRMANWATTDFTVETNPTPQFPSIQARQVNGLITLRFNMTASQAAAAHTLRIGITTAYINGRPNVSVNSWNSPNSAAPNEPSTRTFTVGTYRGNNWLYTYSVPASAFVTGQNVLTIFPISGSSDLGGWLSAGYVFDCVQLDGTPIVPLAPKDVAANLNPQQVNLSWTPVFNAVSYIIKRSTTSGGPYTAIATNVVAEFTDTNVVAAMRYHYVVRSVNSTGQSVDSAETVAGIGPAPVAYLPFNENSGTTSIDAAGNGWHGTLTNGANWNTGQYGSAANLDGINDYVGLPAGIVSQLSDFTIAAWVNQNSVTNWARVFDFGNSTISYMFLTPRAVNSSGPIRFGITVGSSAAEQSISGTSALPTGWHHVAVTHEGNVGILYVDGVAVGTNSAMTLKPSDLGLATKNYSGLTMNDYIGKSQWNDPTLNGRVDDFRIYNAAMSPAQISALMATPPFAPVSLVANVVSNSQVNLTWTTAQGAVDYNVLRALTSGGPYTTIASGLTVTNYSDTNVTSGTTYYYVVAAVDTIGAGLNSPEASAVVPAPIWTGLGANDNWTTGLNWLGGFAPATSSASITFAGGTRLTPNLDTSYSVAGLTFSNNASSFVIGTANASTLTLAGGVTNNSANPQNLNVPVTLGATANLNAAAGNLTLSNSLNRAGNLLTVVGASNTILSGPISGSGSLFKQGSGTLTVRTNATWDLAQASSGGFSGPLIAQAGTLSFNNGSSNLVNGELVIGGVVANGGAGNDAKIVVDNAKLNVGSWLSIGRGNGVGGVSSDLVLTNGATVTAANASAGFDGGSSANKPKGSVTLNDTSSLSINGVFHVAEAGGANVSLNVNGSSTLSVGGLFDMGLGFGGTVANLTVNGGTVNCAGDPYIGHWGNGTATLTLNNGTVNVGTVGERWLYMGYWDWVNGQININGGELKFWTNSKLRMARNVNSGTNTFTHVINQNGGAATFYSNAGTTPGGTGFLDMQFDNAATNGTMTYNLNGGVLTVPAINSTATTGSRIFNFNGGTLKAAVSGTLMNLGAGNAHAYVRTNGAIVDDSNLNATMATALEHFGGDPTDGGLTKNGNGTATLTAANTYNGPTTINSGTLALSGGGSIGSSPTINLASGATFNVAGVAGYTLGGSQTLKGNGTVTGATIINGTVAPGASIGTLTFGTAPTMSGTTLMEINRTNAPNADKLVLSSGALNYGGTLTVTNIGGALQAGDSFQLFSAPGGYGSSFATTNLPTLGAGLAWSNSLAVNGTLAVVATVSLVPTNITYSVSNSMLTLNWPADHTGWRLQGQNNSLAMGLGTNWFDVGGSTTTNTVQVPINLIDGTVFYRLVYP